MCQFGHRLCGLPVHSHPTNVILALGARTHRAAYSGVRRWSGAATDFTDFVYVLASYLRGTLYIGVTNGGLLFRVGQHRAGEGGKFTRRYKVTLLVWFEQHASIEEAIKREKNLKR